MRIDLGSLAFGYSIKQGGGTPNWATSLGQNKEYKINENNDINEILKGLIYCSVPLSNVSTKIGKGGKCIYGNDNNSPIIIGSVFSKVFINNIEIENSFFILLITKDTSESHKNRLRLKYGPSNTYSKDSNIYKNEQFYENAKKQLQLQNACWFVYDIKIYEQNELYLSAIIVSQDKQQTYNNSTELTSQWNQLISAKTQDISSQPINMPHQRIFFGAPGTGKSYQLNLEAKKFFKNNFERVTFHSSYIYGNFVGSFKPFPKKTKINTNDMINECYTETITYEYIPGVLIRQLIKAIQNPDENYLVLIEEINRANITAVFGDIFQLLDRDENGDSEYFITTSIELQEFLKKEFAGIQLNESIQLKIGYDFNRLYLPKNFFIWATMNSADQGVLPLDTAFKRRWQFEYLGVDVAANLNKEEFSKYKFRINNKEVALWDDFRREINKRLSSLNIPEDKLIGSYFISKPILNKSNIDELTIIIKNKVLMYLYEDAAKGYRQLLFSDEKYSTFSTLCKHFDENALLIFRDKIEITTMDS